MSPEEFNVDVDGPVGRQGSKEFGGHHPGRQAAGGYFLPFVEFATIRESAPAPQALGTGVYVSSLDRVGDKGYR